MKPFETPKQSPGDLNSEVAAALLAAASDISLVIDGDGVIRDIALGSALPSPQETEGWMGRYWRDTVTAESRSKVDALLRDADAKSAPHWRHLNHSSATGHDVPISYTAIGIGNTGRVLAVGRDLRAIAAIQQQLVAAQQSMERDYSRLRQVETRFQLLFQSAAEAVVLLDAVTYQVLDANPAACFLLGRTVKQMNGRSFAEGLDAASARALSALLGAASTTGRADRVNLRSVDGKLDVQVSATLLRQEPAALLMLRLASSQPSAEATAASRLALRMMKIAQHIPDGLVITDPHGRILSANLAFLDMLQLVSEDSVIGESLERWLGRPGVDLSVMISNLRQHGSLRLFTTKLRCEFGSATEVEISAVSLLAEAEPCLGFSIRNIERRLASEAVEAKDRPRSVEQLTEMVGRMPLKNLVREATDLIERLSIEAALELTDDNRASAADLLGLSRQSLYVKLRRYGLGDLSAENESLDEISKT